MTRASATNASKITLGNIRVRIELFMAFYYHSKSRDARETGIVELLSSLSGLTDMQIPRRFYERVGPQHMVGCVLGDHAGECAGLNKVFGKIAMPAPPPVPARHLIAAGIDASDQPRLASLFQDTFRGTGSQVTFESELTHDAKVLFRATSSDKAIAALAKHLVYAYQLGKLAGSSRGTR